MLIAIVLDRPLAEPKALVEAPDAFIQAITRIMQDKQNQPVIAQMIRPGVSDPPPTERTASSSGGYSHRGAGARTPAQPQTHFQRTVQREILTVATHRKQTLCHIDLRHRCCRST